MSKQKWSIFNLTILDLTIFNLTIFNLTIFNLTISTNSVIGQILPDTTLPNNSLVTPVGITFTIDGGTALGNNLFHSFQEFSVPTGTEAFFNNGVNLNNIITRVTGNQISDIDGVIRTKNNADLFLLNPNGIVFGPNARLNFNGSFLASTANSLLFSDGTNFSATNPQASPLLTVNVPLGVQYGNSVAEVQVQQSRLEVSPHQNLALLGGNVSIDGGTLLAPGGQVSVGGLAEAGIVSLQGTIPSFPQTVQRGDIYLSNSSLIEVTGTSGGSITIDSNNLNLAGGSQLLAGIAVNGNLVDATAGDIVVNASGDITLDNGSLISNRVPANTLGTGGDIELSANTLALTSGSRITTVTQSSGKAGNIFLEASNVAISGFTADGLFSGILSLSETANSGAGGNILINQDDPQGTIRLANRGFIAAVTNSSSDGGAIEVNGANLVLESGGQILTLATDSGNAGDVTLNISETVRLSGSSQDFISSPFDGFTVFNLDQLAFSTAFNPNIEASGAGGIPYVAVQRTPGEIISGATVLGTAEEQYDYYSFTITEGNSRGIFDIDFGDGYTDNPGSLDTEIALFNQATGEILASNDDTNLTNGAQGSIVRQDSYISFTFDAPGTYVVGVGEFDTVPNSLQGLEGDRVDPGDTYSLHISLENQGTGIALPPNNLNPNHFNPNYGFNSGLFSVTEAAGNTGRLNINTRQLQMDTSAEIATTTLGSGRSRDITINARDNIGIINRSTISNITRGSGNAGSIILNTEDVRLANRGFISISNFGQGNTGDIRINTNNLSVFEGARLNNSTYLLGDAGKIIINARDSVVFDGEDSLGQDSNAFNLVAGPSAVGNSGGIEVNTRHLSITNGAQLATSTYGEGNAGGITINASESVLLDGKASSGRLDGLLTRVRVIGRGNAGDINIATNSLTISNEARVSSQTEGQGNAGSVNITAQEVFVDDGLISSSAQPTAIGSGGQISITADSISLTNSSRILASTSGEGDAGDIRLRANRLEAREGSQLSTSTDSDFDAGSITLDVTDSILLSEKQTGLFANTAVGSGGNSGNIFVAKPRSVTIRDGAGVGVSSQGAGIGGSIQLQAGSLTLDNQAFLTAATAANQGGEILLLLDEPLLMRNNSQITATAGTAGAGGDGGNIEINAPFIVAIPTENSDITANAFEGNGGRITLTAKGIFGLEFREQLTPFSDITASSQFGVSGSVNISNPEVNPASGLVKLPEEVADSTEQVIARCAAAEGNSFTLIGQGGIPEDPTAPIRGQTVWRDLQDFSVAEEQPQQMLPPSPPPVVENLPSEIVEATGWIVDAEGNVELVAQLPDGTVIYPVAQHPECVVPILENSLINNG
ncbi:MAG: filamentous hemagglutinin N-terminal domain-containing protein [Symploca sp. SIO2G7]|nr:filamentous hemagglutinin N-terminal domain-containing protein [Symploca sp. SIO2G7]